MLSAAYAENKFFGLDQLMQKITPALDEAERSMNQFESLLNGLPGSTPAAKVTIDFGRDYINRQRPLLEVYRTPRAELAMRVLDKPLEGLNLGRRMPVWTVFFPCDRRYLILYTSHDFFRFSDQTTHFDWCGIKQQKCKHFFSRIRKYFKFVQ